jgi:hypothetical protein
MSKPIVLKVVWNLFLALFVIMCAARALDLKAHATAMDPRAAFR